jgi:glycosyltransferase involved in cell wall biosynthesis
MSAGISAVICTHNGKDRLGPVLDHLRAQRTSLPFEVLVVDNASTDGTAEFCSRYWEQFEFAGSQRVVLEPELGLSPARQTGLRLAKYEFVVFVDDDNWLAPEYLEIAAQIMGSRPDVGACGGPAIATFESEIPEWFERFEGMFAVGRQAAVEGDVTESRGYLWGAGLVLRRSAVLRLFELGFQHQLVDRKGKELSSGGDTEICNALVLSGWRLWYSPALELRHWMPEGRLEWRRLVALSVAFGACSTKLDRYAYAAGRTRLPNPGRFLRQAWMRLALLELMKLMERVTDYLRNYGSLSARQTCATKLAYQYGRVRQLFKDGGSLETDVLRIRNSAWFGEGKPA